MCLFLMKSFFKCNLLADRKRKCSPEAIESIGDWSPRNPHHSEKSATVMPLNHDRSVFSRLCRKHKNFNLKGYNIPSRNPMHRQERHKDAKANHGKEQVQQPGDKLEWVRRPAPAVSAGMLGLSVKSCFIVLLRCCLVWWLITDVHLPQAEKEKPLSEKTLVAFLQNFLKHIFLK